MPKYIKRKRVYRRGSVKGHLKIATTESLTDVKKVTLAVFGTKTRLSSAPGTVRSSVQGVIFADYQNQFADINNGVLGGLGLTSGEWQTKTYPCLLCDGSWQDLLTQVRPMGLRDPLKAFTTRFNGNPAVSACMTDKSSSVASYVDTPISTDRINAEYLLTSKNTMNIFNRENYSQEVEVYCFVPKLYSPNIVNPLTDYTFGLQQQSMYASVGPYVKEVNIEHAMKCKYFNERWRQVSLKKMCMAPGTQVDVSTYLRESVIKFNVLNNVYNYYPGISHCVVVRCRGQYATVRNATDTTNLGISSIPGALTIQQTYKHTFRMPREPNIKKEYVEQMLINGTTGKYRFLNVESDAAVLAVDT